MPQKRVAVIGAGTMGHAIALVFALGGHRVRLTDSNMHTLDRAGGLMEAALATLVAGGEAPADWTSGHLAQAITRHATLEECIDGAELIVEAIIEQPEAKRALFAQLDALAGPDAVIASNTSELDVFPLIPEARRGRAVIAHWYTPPYLVDLVDLIPAPGCDPTVLADLANTLREMGKQPITLRKFVPGYVANRIQAAINLEVQHLLDEGVASAAEIDAAAIHGLALRLPIVGLFAKQDFTGLPLLQALAAQKNYLPPPVTGSSASLDALVAAGRTGVLAGAGHYDWPGDPASLFEARDRKLIALKQALRTIGTLAGLERDMPHAPGRDSPHAPGRDVFPRAKARPVTARYDLAGRTALVTGAASGIGLATATLLAESGARVAINHLADDPRGPEAVDALRGRGFDAIGVAGDVGSEGGCSAIVMEAVATLGRLDFLVNNAGTPGTRTTIAPEQLDRLDDALWQAVIDVNLLGVFRCTRAAAPALRATQGAVVNVASIAGLDSVGSSLAYGATKAGVINMTKNLARALAPEVRVNAVAPGAVDSAWQIEWTNAQRASSIDKALLRRRCTPADLAEVMVFLLASAGMVTGQTVTVDGGLTLG